MGFLLAPQTQKTLSQVLHRTSALMDPNNGGAGLTLQPETCQFTMMAFQGQFLKAEGGASCMVEGACVYMCPSSGALSVWAVQASSRPACGGLTASSLL